MHKKFPFGSVRATVIVVIVKEKNFFRFTDLILDKFLTIINIEMRKEKNIRDR